MTDFCVAKKKVGEKSQPWQARLLDSGAWLVEGYKERRIERKEAPVINVSTWLVGLYSGLYLPRLYNKPYIGIKNIWINYNKPYIGTCHLVI